MPLIINVNPDWRIRTGNDQFILETKTKPAMIKGEMTEGGKWAAKGYVSTIDEIWNFLYHRQILALDGEYGFDALHKLTDELKIIRDDIKAAANG